MLGEFFRVGRLADHRGCADPQCAWTVKDDAPPIAVPDTAEPHPERATAPVTVSYLTEQTSHHPPVSAFWVACPEKGVSACGFDQISAKFTGTSIRVTSGQHNLGIFVKLERRDDELYQMTHPAAHLGGLLRGKWLSGPSRSS